MEILARNIRELEKSRDCRSKATKLASLKSQQVELKPVCQEEVCCRYPKCVELAASGKKLCVRHGEANRLRQKVFRLQKKCRLQKKTSAKDLQLLEDTRSAYKALQVQLKHDKKKKEKPCHSVSLHKSKAAATLAARGRRPDNEYVQGSGSTKERPERALIFECCDPKCPKLRKVTLDKATGTWEVSERGGEHEHEAAFRRSYPWSLEQLAALKMEFDKGTTLSILYLKRKLDRLKLLNDATDEDIERIRQKEKLTTRRWDNSENFTLNQLQNLIEGFRGNIATDDDALQLIPLATGDESYLLMESNDVCVAKITGQAKPKVLADGTPYAFSIPLASKASLRRAFEISKVPRFRFATMTVEGAQMEAIDPVALGMMDGICSSHIKT